MRIGPLAVGGIIKEWPPWENLCPLGIPIGNEATQAVRDFVKRLNSQIVVNVVVEVTPCE